MTDRRRRSPERLRTRRVEIRVTPAEALLLAADADRLAEGSISLLLRIAWRAYTQDLRLREPRGVE